MSLPPLQAIHNATFSVKNKVQGVLKRVSREVPGKVNPMRFHLTWVEIPRLAVVDSVAAVTVVAKAMGDMAGP